MSSVFDEREKAFEARYRIEQDLDFRVRMRRDRLLGLWAAGLMGLEGDEAAAYAHAVVDSVFDRPDHDASHKVAQDLAARGVEMRPEDLLHRLGELHAIAYDQVLAELSA